MLDLAATTTGYKEITKPEVALWLELLEPYPASEIEKAFKAYLAEAEFFPKPAQILVLLNAGAEEARASRQVVATAALMAENRRIRDELKRTGQPYGIEQYHGIIQQAREMVRRIPAPEPGRRERLKARLLEIKGRTK